MILGKQVITSIWSQGASDHSKEEIHFNVCRSKIYKTHLEFELSKNTFLEDYNYSSNKSLLRF